MKLEPIRPMNSVYLWKVSMYGEDIYIEADGHLSFERQEEQVLRKIFDCAKKVYS